MTTTKTRILTMCAIAIAINVVLGILTGFWKIPLYLDTIGTVLIAVYFGPWYGAAVGGATNLLSSLLSNPKAIPFMIVSIVIGLIVGFVARKYKFTFGTALILGVVLGVVAPLVGTPIGVWVYGGLTGTISDVFVIWLKESGMGIFGASFLPKLFNNLMDKIGTCLLAYALIKALPKNLQPAKK